MRKPKRITQATLTGERGISLIAEIAMSMGLVWYPTGSVEAGIDGHLELRDPETGEVFNAVIGVQSKATDRAFANETDTGLDFYCDERDIDYWLNGNLPVILIASRPATREAYWVSVKDYFRDPGRRATKKVHFHKSADRFDERCRDALFRLATPQDAGLYLAPPRKHELLISNLLPIAFLAPQMYVAPTRFREPRDVWRAARDAEVSIGGEWILRNKTIVSLCDLRRPEWATMCDQGAVDDIGTDEWSDTDDPDRRRDFVDLLSRTLRVMVRTDLDFHERFGFFYFRATPDLAIRQLDYKSLVMDTDRDVFRGYEAESGDRVKYYRHSAFYGRFRRHDRRWYLEINPTYHFTSDGYRLRSGYQGLLKGIKAKEGHLAVRGQLVMWGAFLCPRGDLFADDPYPYLGFGDLVMVPAERGIDDASWTALRAGSTDEAQKTEATGTAAGPAMLPLFA